MEHQIKAFIVYMSGDYNQNLCVASSEERAKDIIDKLTKLVKYNFRFDQRLQTALKENVCLDYSSIYIVKPIKSNICEMHGKLLEKDGRKTIQ